MSILIPQAHNFETDAEFDEFLYMVTDSAIFSNPTLLGGGKVYYKVAKAQQCPFHGWSCVGKYLMKMTFGDSKKPDTLETVLVECDVYLVESYEYNYLVLYNNHPLTEEWGCDQFTHIMRIEKLSPSLRSKDRGNYLKKMTNLRLWIQTNYIEGTDPLEKMFSVCEKKYWLDKWSKELK